jgi:hypothetical protein
MKRPLFALPFLLAAACSYDWTVGPRGGSSSGGEGGAEGGSSGATSGSSGNTGCDTLRSQKELARLSLLACNGTTCPGSVQDECGCTLAVSDAQSSAAKAYTAAVAAYKNAGCADACSECQTVVHQCLGGTTCA